MKTSAMYYPITAKSSAAFKLYINGSLCATCTGSASAPVSINATVQRGWDIIPLVAAAAPSASFSLVLAGQTITPDMLRCASIAANVSTSHTFDTSAWAPPSLAPLPATFSALGSLSLPDLYFAPPPSAGAAATVCQLTAPAAMPVELSCDRSFDVFVKGQWAGHGGGITHLMGSGNVSGHSNVSTTWKFNLTVTGQDVVAVQARSFAFGGCIGTTPSPLTSAPLSCSKSPRSTRHFWRRSHVKRDVESGVLRQCRPHQQQPHHAESQQPSHPSVRPLQVRVPVPVPPRTKCNNSFTNCNNLCRYSTQRRGLVVNGSALLPKSSQQSARPSYPKSAPAPGVDGSTNLYRWGP